MTTFTDLGLPETIVHRLETLDVITPTPIQQKAIPVALEGKDILGSAQTGTGKTAAFGLPAVTKLIEDPKSAALVLTPTRELAEQVMKQLQSFIGRRSNIKTALLIGGDPIGKQFRQLRAKPRLIVGTPGRICDHIDRDSLDFSQTNFLVLDETDRMLDMGFTQQLSIIMEQLPEDRQTLLFSATLPKNIMRLTNDYLVNPERIAVDAVSSVAKNITQEMVKVQQNEKYSTLIDTLKDRDGSIIIFMKTKFSTERLATRLEDDGYKARAIHGDLRQNKRQRVIEAFKKKKYQILVATDVAARGLDISHIRHVINYDLPQCPEDYVHRIGRTARAGMDGHAISFVTPQERMKWKDIDRVIHPEKYKDEKPRSDSYNKDRKPKRFDSRKKSFKPKSAKVQFKKKRYADER